MKVLIILLIVIGVLIVLKLIAQGKGFSVRELVRSWFPTVPTSLEKGEEPLVQDEYWKIQLEQWQRALFGGVSPNPTTTEPLIAQIPSFGWRSGNPRA